MPIGLLDEREYEETVFQAQPGDVFLLCSDGVLDQLNPKEEEYGRQRLVKVVKRVCESEPRQIADEILADLDEFTEGRRRFDDQSILALRVPA
jgi:sigma-B regulation protein RsbU (phosphoserine phosphatase)